MRKILLSLLKSTFSTKHPLKEILYKSKNHPLYIRSSSYNSTPILCTRKTVDNNITLGRSCTMDDFLSYLREAKEATKRTSSYKKMHIVLGNESCDLDSTVSSIILAYFLNKYRTEKISDSIIIPILNVISENFLFRTENCFVLNECGIPLDIFIYRDQVNIEELLKTKNITTSLVDHHVLSKSDKILENTVIQIIDHRPIDPSSNWSSKNVELRIEEVGSCSTLIAEKIFQVNENFLCKEAAYLIYETMIYDTVALLPENGRAKELDLTIAKKLEDRFSFTEGRKLVFEKLVKAHNDVFHLTTKQMLLKDLKIIDSIPVPGLPMLVENFLKLEDAYNSIKSLGENNNSSIVVLIGLEANKGVQRDVGIYWNRENSRLKDILLDMLKRSEDLKGYNFCFSEICLEYDNVICLRQNNIKLTRKQVVPIINDAVKEYTKTNCK